MAESSGLSLGTEPRHFLGSKRGGGGGFYDQGPVVQKPTNANPRLKINQGVDFFTPKCCSTLIFSKTLH